MALSPDKKQAKTVSAEDFLELITFFLSDEMYGIDIMKTQEVVPMTELTYVPNSLEYVEGIFNLRGSVIPVINLRKKINLSQKGSKADNILLVKFEGYLLGILIDAMHKKVVTDRNKIIPPPAVIAGVGKEYIHGLTKDEDGKLIIVLDVANLFSTRELRVIDDLRQY
jgi:purine-binding chemotaxis protein CheW